MSYVNPVPGGKVGRTDQGVDISAPPRTPVYAIDRETLVGRISNWYHGQPLYWFKQAGGKFNYVAEQFRSTLKPGQTVDAGQQIGTVAPSGTGLELGWATASGQTLASATSGYTEGQDTPAGKSYKSQVIQGGAVRPGGDTPGSSGSSADQVFTNWKTLRDTPRTAPPGTKNPFQWWLASFTSNWDNLASSSGGGTATDASVPSGGQTYGQVSYDQVLALSQQEGWSPQEAQVWFSNLIPSESNGTITDTNPSSHAYGIAQGIDGPSWYYRHGGNPNTVIGQLTGMRNYIKQRYTTPSAAWAFHKKNGWY